MLIILAVTLLNYCIRTLLNIRHYINRIILENQDGLTLSTGDFSVFWLTFDIILMSPIIFNHYHISRLISLPLFSTSFLIIPISYGVYWIYIRKFNLRAILAVIAALIGASLVVITQLACIIINIAKLLTTSPNYEGKVRYLRITPY